MFLSHVLNFPARVCDSSLTCRQPSQAIAATYNSDRISALSVATCYTNKLNGTIPDRISDLVNLQTVVSGIILVELSQISFLQRLSIGNNNLEGQIPDKIFERKRLTELYLMSNKFVGSILNSISNLEMLTKLDLSGNRYNGSLGDSMTKLNQLIWIDLSHNFFTGLTSGQLIARIPNELLKMEMVQGIDISNNNLSGGTPETIQNCRNLQSLHLLGNQLSGSIYDEIFPALDVLSYINFSRNKLEGEIPGSMANLTLLILVDLS
ncbi:hypothetical protein L1987_53070 [Smallanthus sonchifolius]|uniref:Uncharacterized protein n=1 Tax=Smallanthus sonchifolius TaxID=185202 RepID=A0ACB9EUV9_9ASTR|nr:hypothetical protein L1987_53070 [Smallanthus sonchifolius]